VAEGRKGLLLGLAAYTMWGLFPLYWPLLRPAGPVEMLAHRVLWSAVTMLVIVAALRRFAQVRGVLRTSRQRRILVVAAVLITVNWGVYIYGVVNEHVVETSLGYFIGPLVTVALGVLVLHETLRPVQKVALGMTTAAVLGLTLDYGRPPWIALTLAVSFAVYGLLKKQVGAGAVEGLTIESAVMAPVALVYLVWLQATGGGHAFSEGPGHLVLLMSSGLVTALPLLCFGGAASRISLTTIGMVQYVGPTLQFLTGVFLLGEPMPAARWIGFAVIWLALALFTADAVRGRRRTPVPVEVPT
jgi:chloramphenicol-sensitive protein RarD